jgi:hypothetical protein
MQAIFKARAHVDQQKCSEKSPLKHVLLVLCAEKDMELQPAGGTATGQREWEAFLVQAWPWSAVRVSD